MIGSKVLLCETGKTDKRYQRTQSQSAEVDCNSHELSLKESNGPLQILEHSKRDHGSQKLNERPCSQISDCLQLKSKNWGWFSRQIPEAQDSLAAGYPAD